jgi:hypothetical protein
MGRLQGPEALANARFVNFDEWRQLDAVAEMPLRPHFPCIRVRCASACQPHPRPARTLPVTVAARTRGSAMTAAHASTGIARLT